MATRSFFTAGVPVLTGASTVSHSRGAASRSGRMSLVSPSQHRAGFCYSEMPADSVVRLEGPALSPAMLKARCTSATLGR